MRSSAHLLLLSLVEARVQLDLLIVGEEEAARELRGGAVLGADVLRAVGHGVLPDVLGARKVDPPVPRPAWTRVSQRRVVRVPLLQMGELPNMERAARR